ncbi:MAG: cell filamentation protein Fic [Methylophaga sp.]|nr:MAG: cell filamentation protein Fic [Methylophaga sp.]
MDIFLGINAIKRIETYKFGVFKLQQGLDASVVDVLLQRVQDAQQRFKTSPLASVATLLEKEVVVNSVFGTNTIEGGELSEQETALALSLSPEQIQNTQQQRVINIKSAYDYVREVSVAEQWHPTLDNVFEIYRKVTADLEAEEERNMPGLLRSNPDGVVTQVGNIEHGGVYRPPQNGDDIRLLLESLLAWNIKLAEQGVPALIRAPLVHLYFEIIHPFWDGNGRVGRVLEAGILYADGFHYAPFAQANYYLQHIHQYFALFNGCRKKAAKKSDFPNSDFVAFFLEGLLSTINHLHDRVNLMVQRVLFEMQLKHLHDEKTLNNRQYAIANEVLKMGEGIAVRELRQAPWHQALYSKLTPKTQSRDLKNLLELKLVVKDEKDHLFPGFVDLSAR